MKLVVRTACLFALLALTGCGTIRTISSIRDARNRADRQAMCDTRKFLSTSILYSGTYDNVVNRIFSPFTCHGDECPSLLAYPFRLIGALVDLPAAIVADTLMLAYTVPVSLSLRCDEPPASTPAPGRDDGPSEK